ncbi:hypothetical protein [Tabrizicola sp.]|uniref:hypothetical protein n=1 Tax=Tabrizicola sp. TaxID=2005166 RepID=UPI003D2733A5
MSEPAGVLLQAGIGEAALAAVLTQKVSHGGDQVEIGHLLCDLLFRGDADGDILILNHDPATDLLFLGWVLNHYSAEPIAPIWPVLDRLAKGMGPGAKAEGVLVSTFGRPWEKIGIDGARLTRRAAENVDAGLAQRLSDRLWSFARKGQFPDAAASMRARKVQCKPFRTAWTRYTAWQAEKERPFRIRAATPDDPFWLYPDFAAAGDEVWEWKSYTKTRTVIPGADPASFRKVGDVFVDHRQVWVHRLAAGSPPATVPTGKGGTRANPDAVWEYAVVPGADGGSLTWLFNRWDTIFYRDADRVYAMERGVGLVALPGVSPTAFRPFGDSFGTDGMRIWSGRHPLPLDLRKTRRDGFFLWDDAHVFLAHHRLPLEAAGFRVLMAG